MDKRLLLVGIGNNSRGDDGLGWKVADAAATWEGVEVEYRYQLQVEDAAMIKDYDTVIFVDASARELPGGFTFKPCEAEQASSFTTHRLDPGSILWLCRELYGVEPTAYVLAIEGEQFELGRALSEAAQQNLERSVAYLEERLSQSWNFKINEYESRN